MAIPKIIHQTWKDLTSIPTVYAGYTQEWKNLHPEYVFKMYTDADNLLFITTNFPQYLQMYNAFPHNIQRVDLVRYLYLKFYGGVYIDMDIAPFKSMDPLLNDQTLVFPLLTDGTKHVTNAWMASTENNPFWDNLLAAICVAKSATGNVVADVHRTTGSVVLSSVVAVTRGVSLLPRITYHSFHWSNTIPTDASTFKNNPQAYGVHMYGSSWIPKS